VEVNTMQEIHLKLENGMHGKLVKLDEARLKQLSGSFFKPTKVDGLNFFAIENLHGGGGLFPPKCLTDHYLLILNGTFKTALVMGYRVKTPEKVEHLLSRGWKRLFYNVMFIWYEQQLLFIDERRGQVLRQAIEHNVPPLICPLIYGTIP
jgi:hypothetical protein